MGCIMATIKELSESIGISKRLIRQNFAFREQKRAEVVQDNVETKTDITSEILALLREQLESKDREIERLHKQVDDLQKINADMVKAVRELNTLQAMQLTDGSERTESEPRENESLAPKEHRENSEKPAGGKGLIYRLKRLF